MERGMPVKREKHLSGRKSTKKEIEARKKRRFGELRAKQLKAKADKPKWVHPDEER
jgi:hypothetical protein